jgi:hypothetical protein
LGKYCLSGAHFASLASVLLAENTNFNPYRSHLQNPKSPVPAIVLDICRTAKRDNSDEIGHRGIGLGSSILVGSIVRFQNPNGLKNRWNSNWEGISDEALKYYAEILLEYGKSFLADPKADWIGLLEWDRKESERIRERSLAERPWLKKFPSSIHRPA